MSEKIPTHNVENAEKTVLERITWLREYVLSSNELLEQWSTSLVVWDKAFKQRLKESYGSTQYAQQVSQWQTLVGGTPEEETDITDEIREYILDEVDKFVSGFERTLQEKN